MKYAVCMPADQTITYLSLDVEVGWCETTKHPDAFLWDTYEEADQMALQYQGSWFQPQYMVEEVPDEEEFKSREDTW